MNVESTPRILLFAAGFARRFGRDKTLCPMPDGEPMALHAARRILQAGCTPVLIVRPEQQVLAARAAALPLEVILAPAAYDGLGASIAAAVQATSAAHGWLIALADMPGILPESYRAAFDRLQSGPADLIVAPSFHGQRGHPVGFGPAWRQALSQLNGDSGARILLQRHHDRVCLFDCDDPAILQDIDSPGDLPGSASTGDGEPGMMHTQ
jgi:molybdenum cofactor cytidylyltransferase